MRDEDKKELVQKVQGLVGSTSIEALVSFIATQVNREIFASVIHEFSKNLSKGGWSTFCKDFYMYNVYNLNYKIINVQHMNANTFLTCCELYSFVSNTLAWLFGNTGYCLLASYFHCLILVVKFYNHEMYIAWDLPTMRGEVGLGVQKDIKIGHILKLITITYITYYCYQSDCRDH